MVRPPSMPTIETAPRDDSQGLSSSRADFAANLQRRLDSATAALSEFEQQPTSPERRDNFLRRIHALRASAKVLGFAAASEVLSRAEQQIRTCPTDSPGDDIGSVRKQLELLPNLVLRGTYSLAPPSPQSVRPKSLAPLLSEPLAIVAWGTAELIEAIRSIERSTNCLEVFLVQDPDALRSTCAAVGPDVLLLDANQGSITLLVTDLAQAAETASVPIVVANVPDVAAEGLKELGARLVLPTHVSEHQLSQALFQARLSPQLQTAPPSPIGDVSLNELAEHLAQEIRQGLVESAISPTPLERISFGDGTSVRAALWSALAQIREQIVDASAGRVRFASGPEGAEPIAPRNLPNARHRALSTGVDLTGRRILVADDDPAVAWFVGGTLRAAGAVVTEVHDGSQALELAYRIWPEIIVSDILMPGLDGFALCHAIKHDVLLRDLPILLLSWKEDLLFRLRDLGADADGYLRKEASASTLVRRVKELLLPRSALERRLALDQESRGRLDGTTTRLLLEIAAALERPVRIALRDASALYDLRLRHGTLVAATLTNHDGSVLQGEAVIGPLLGISAARFSVITDREDCEPMFSGALAEVIRPSVLRARAAQRLLSGARLGTVERLSLAKDAFGAQLPPLPLSLRPLADELLRGTAPRKLLGSGAAPTQLLESLLSDLARRGAVLSIEDADGRNLLEQEVTALKDTPPVQPPKPAQQVPRFTFQLPAVPDGQSPETLDAPENSSNVPLGAVARPTTDRSESAEAAGGVAAHLATPGVSTRAEPERSPSAGADVVDWKAVEERSTSGDPLQTTVGKEPIIHATPAESFAPAVTSISPLGAYTPVTSLIPQQVAVASKPPPSDDFDWALELSWDSTPPPSGSSRPAAPQLPDQSDGQSQGLIQGAVTPERNTPPETPELAVVVGHAASEVTPSPGLFMAVLPKPAGTATATATPSPIGPSSKASSTSASLGNPAPTNSWATSTPGNSARSSLSGSKVSISTGAVQPDGHADAQPTFNLKPSAVVSPAAPTATAEATVTQSSAMAVAEPPLTHGNPPLDQSRPLPEHTAESPIALPVVYQPPRPKGAVQTERELQPHPGPRKTADPSPVEDPVFPLVSSPTPHMVEIRGTVEIVPESPQTQTAKPTALESPVAPAPTRDTLRSPTSAEPESDVSLVPMQVSPAPSAEGSSPAPLAEATAIAAIAAASPALDDQAPPAFAGHTGEASLDVQAPPTRSPLANVPALEVEPPKSRLVDAPTSKPADLTEAEAAKTLISPTEREERPRPRTARNAPRPAAVFVAGPRQVGWLQALGLATLAGIVTFAATVPIASWVHRRQERRMPNTPTLDAGVTTIKPADGRDEHPAEGSSAAPESSVASAEGTVATKPADTAVTTLEIPIPSNVVLKPGEGVIEISTGGDHAVFIDDAFVGRGPLRVVPIGSGQHVVRTRLNGAERSDPIEVTAGRGLRLSLESAWK